MEQGPIESKVIERCGRSGTPLPKVIQNAPEIQMGLEVYYQAFMHLNTCRSLGFSVGPIPWTSVVSYGEVHGFDDHQKEDLFFFMHSMDNAFLEYNRKQQKTEK